MAYPSAPPPPPQQGGNRTLVVIAVVLAVTLVVVGLGVAAALYVISQRGQTDGGLGADPGEPPSQTESLPPAPAELSRYYDQKLRWRDCGGNECTRLTVPLDYADPDGEEIKIAVLRVPAEDRRNRIGQLVINPGGPGASGVDYAAYGAQAFGEKLARRYDIVGFDPRGVGRSTAIKCLTTKETDDYFASDPDPDTPEEEKEYEGFIQRFGEACERRSGDLAAHVSTVEAAKDVDVLRAALGEAELDWFGGSYGTFLGATYADLFPQNVGRMVLDGAVDPALSTEELGLMQTQGFQTALTAYLEDCVANGCPLGDSVASAQQRLQDLLADLDQEPIGTGTDRDLTQGLAVYGIITPLYSRSGWPVLTASLGSALDGDGNQLLQLADQYTERGDGRYDSNFMQAISAINCLDHGDPVPFEDVPSRFEAFEKASPVFGRFFAYSLSACDGWPVGSGEPTKAPRAAGAPPIVVIGTTRDPATPYEMAISLADELESGRLVTRDGDGHTGFQAGNQCIDDAVEAFLLRGKVPREGLRC